MMTPDDLASWGWRVPFLLSVLIGLAGFALRRNLGEAVTPKTAAAAPSPLVEVLRHRLPTVLRIAGLVAFNAIAFQLAFLYVVHWLQVVDGIAPAHALKINTISMLAIMPVALASGWLSDFVGRKKILLIGTALGFVGAVPLFMLMHHNSTELIMLGQFGFVIAIGMAFGVMPAITVETVPLSVRCTATAIGNNISYSILGGLTPLFATWLVYRTADDFSPAYLIMIAAALSFVAALCHPESFRDKFEAPAAPAK